MSDLQEATVVFPPLTDLADLIEAELGYRFQDLNWLERALTHRSLQAPGNEKSHYERLEFIGDAVLDLAVAHLLLDCYPHSNEGELSKMRAALVNAGSLAEHARKFGLGAHIRLSRGEIIRGGADKSSILADVVESLFGAIYREGGFVPAFQCVERMFNDQVRLVAPFDPKTELQELLHARGLRSPNYRLDCVEGPEHSPTFVSSVEIDGIRLGTGRGGTKKGSHQAAAAAVLSYIAAGGVIPVEGPVASDPDAATQTILVSLCLEEQDCTE